MQFPHLFEVRIKSTHIKTLFIAISWTRSLKAGRQIVMAAVGPCYSSDSCARSHTAKFCKFASELQIHERLTRRQGALTIETVSLSCLRTRQLASRKACGVQFWNLVNSQKHSAPARYLSISATKNHFLSATQRPSWEEIVASLRLKAWLVDG